MEDFLAIATSEELDEIYDTVGDDGAWPTEEARMKSLREHYKRISHDGMIMNLVSLYQLRGDDSKVNELRKLYSPAAKLELFFD